MKAKLTREMDGADGAKLPIGHPIDHPECWRLVTMGVAEPDDDECRAKAGMTPEKTAAAKAAYERLSKGMSTGDARFDARDKSQDEESMADVSA